jgi:hypothetical protein
MNCRPTGPEASASGWVSTHGQGSSTSCSKRTSHSAASRRPAASAGTRGSTCSVAKVRPVLLEREPQEGRVGRAVAQATGVVLPVALAQVQVHTSGRASRNGLGTRGTSSTATHRSVSISARVLVVARATIGERRSDSRFWQGSYAVPDLSATPRGRMATTASSLGWRDRGAEATRRSRADHLDLRPNRPHARGHRIGHGAGRV